MTQISDSSPELLLFTDGSFQNGVSSYSLVEALEDEEYELIYGNRLPDHVGILWSYSANEVLPKRSQKEK